jgi:hypothetical protein
MKYGLGIALVVLLGIAAVVYTADLLRGPGVPGTARAEAAEKPGAEPAHPQADTRQANTRPADTPLPLVIDKKAPLLLEEAPAKDPWDVPIGPVADNTACYVCHANYQEEEFVVYHAQANVGCVKCHGESHAHRDDENNTTPPDVIFPPEKIEPNCRECHETHDAPAKDVILRWQERCPGKTRPEDILCMDCHGTHRLKARTVRWDKRTRKLILGGKQEGVPAGAGSTKGKTFPKDKSLSQSPSPPAPLSASGARGETLKRKQPQQP